MVNITSAKETERMPVMKKGTDKKKAFHP